MVTAKKMETIPWGLRFGAMIPNTGESNGQNGIGNDMAKLVDIAMA